MSQVSEAAEKAQNGESDIWSETAKMQSGEKLEAWRQKRRIVQCAVNLASKLAPYVDGTKDETGAGAGTMDRYKYPSTIIRCFVTWQLTSSHHHITNSPVLTYVHLDPRQRPR
jgi:hypothetical protein